jgi:hypothetical protein
MNRMVAMLSGVVVAAGLGVGAFAHEGQHAESTEGKPITVQGELIDTACFATSDGDAKGKDHSACATKCMASGIPAGILPEGSKDADAVLYLLTNPQVLAPYAAQTIKVEGTQYEDKHAIDVKKLSVKDGDNWKEIQLKDEHHKMGKDKTDDKSMKDMPGMKMDHK